MKKVKFHKVLAGERIILKMDKGKCVWTIKCCDCGLEHILLLVPKRNTIEIGAWRRDDIANLVLPNSQTIHPNSKHLKRKGAVHT